MTAPRYAKPSCTCQHPPAQHPPTQRCLTRPRLPARHHHPHALPLCQKLPENTGQPLSHQQSTILAAGRDPKTSASATSTSSSPPPEIYHQSSWLSSTSRGLSDTPPLGAQAIPNARPFAYGAHFLLCSPATSSGEEAQKTQQDPCYGGTRTAPQPATRRSSKSRSKTLPVSPFLLPQAFPPAFLPHSHQLQTQERGQPQTQTHPKLKCLHPEPPPRTPTPPPGPRSTRGLPRLCQVTSLHKPSQHEKKRKTS